MNKVTKPVEEEKPLKDATIGERIDYVRRKKGLSQKDLGKAVDVEDKTIKRYENNKANIPLDMLKKIALVLDVSTDYLLGLEDLESRDITDKKIHKVTGLTDDAISVLEEYNARYDGQVLIPTLNFLIAQEKLPQDEISYEIMSNRADNQEWDEKKKEEWQRIVNKYYEKTFEEWKNKNYIPIISMIEYFLNLKVKDEKIYMVDETIKEFFDDKKIEELFPEAIISNESVADDVYLSQIKKQTKKLKQKYKKRKERRK